ncbi:LTA synthase family protein [Colwellia sp. BRX10-3]|uniref:LTA synthase family protein n=1 Tax=Colwellia sp. BRX10-3 TaxID=2759844 RepID=UPI0015F53A0A|nr:LTA synthase family protein [Colwellia sp. BRX10-3]MBA6391292.1 LTA synthase family protein [Colwellia sp. BRX10-3]
MFKATLNLLRPFVLFSLLLVLTLFIARVGLGLWQIARFNDVNSIVTLLIHGFRIDLSTLGYLLILPAILHPWFMFSKYHKPWLKVLKVMFFIIFICVLFFELTTPAFINEYGFRPNRLFIEYLAYPNEVMKMLFNGHLLTLVVVFSLLILSCKPFWKLLNKVFAAKTSQNSISFQSAAVAFITLFFVLALSARGTIGHRPINPSLVYFSTDPLVNSLTLNSIYSVAHAYKQLGDEKNASKLYGKMTTEKIISLVQQATGLSPQAFTNKAQPSLASRSSIYRGKPKNLVIILEESLGAQYVSLLGGLPLTPEINKLNNQGWAFKNLYATGTRSVRGIEAVITGFTPTPARAVVKLDKSQNGFFTIASLLAKHDYTTQFIYGGESHFDNMKSFFLGNGFADIVDFKDIENPQFVGSWGASDEDLFNQADIELTKLQQNQKPFFSYIFSSSNHDPFEIPDGVVTPIEYTAEQLSQYDEKELSRHKAIQYADYALGKFIAKAKQQPYWQDTIFLVVADHDARALGNELVPIKNFHIPGVILNSTKQSFSDERIVSQIDLAPTLLSLMGISNYSPMLGYDLNNPNVSERAMMQYADNFAYMKNDEVTILQPQKSPMNFSYDFKEKKLTPKKLDKALAEVALAHVLWGSLAYENEWYASEQEEETLTSSLR